MAPITVIETITHLALGGAQKVAVRLAQLLPEVGDFETFLVCGPGEGMYEEARETLGERFIVVPDLKREIDPVADFRAYGQLKKVYRDIVSQAPGPVLVHTHAPKAGVIGPWAAAAAGIDCRVHTLHGLPFHKGQSAKTQMLLSAFAKIGQRKATHTVSVSRTNAAIAQELGYCTEDTLTIIPPCTDEPPDNEPDSKTLRDTLEIPHNRFVVVMVASLKFPKDPFTVLEALALLKSGSEDFPYYCVFVGDGSQRGEVEEKIQSLGLENDVRLAGWRADAGSFMAAADVNVLISYGEGVPLVLVEGLMRGLPTIATDVGGIAEIITGPDIGILIDPADPEALATALEQVRLAVKANSPEKGAMSQYLQAFTAQSVTQAHGLLFKQLLE